MTSIQVTAFIVLPLSLSVIAIAIGEFYRWAHQPSAHAGAASEAPPTDLTELALEQQKLGNMMERLVAMQVDRGVAREVHRGVERRDASQAEPRAR
jgi:hypothetical protein